MKKSKTKIKSKPTPRSRKVTTYPRTAEDTFVTQKMLHSVRDELISHTEKKFQETKSEIHELKSEIHAVKAEVAKLDKSLHKIALLVEEQNNRNKIVLDGLSQLFERQDRIEKKVDSNF